MTAALVGIATSAGLRFDIGERTTLGRSPECTIVLTDVLVSGRHAEIRIDGDGHYRILDLGATHGTYVNGKRVSEVVLGDGDEVIVGATRMRFEDRSPRVVSADTVLIADQDHVVRHRQPVGAPAELDPERLRIAYQIARALATCSDLDQLLREILARVFEAFPAERGAILLRDPYGQLVPRVACRRDGASGQVVLSRSIVEEVASQRVGIVSTDASMDRRFGQSLSVISEGIRAAMAAPMIDQSTVVGVIYVDALTAGVFDARDLDVMATIAGQAALAVGAAQLRATFEVQERMVALGQLSAGLAHDLANVLTTIVGCAELMVIGDDVPPRHRNYARHIARAADQATRLTRRLALLARGRSDVRVTDVDDLVVDIAEGIEQLLGSQVELVIERAGVECPVLVDPIEVEQVLINLALNARDAMSGNGQLTLAMSRIGDFARLAVTDTGSGIPPDVVKRVFEPFFTTKAPGRGTGIGLALVHQLVTRARGRIRIDSTPGRGTTFYVDWPLTQAAPAAVEPARGRGELVVVVDDDSAVRDVIVAVLEGAGYTVAPAGDGESALAATADRPVRVFVVDLVMAGMTGRQFVERARAMHAKARALYVSGYGDVVELEALVVGGARVLPKPFSARDLVAAVAAVLHGPDPTPVLPEPAVVTFATGAALLEHYDELGRCFEAPDELTGERAVALEVALADSSRSFRMHCDLERIPNGTRITPVASERGRLELLLASARGESVPYFRRGQRRALRFDVRVTTDHLAIATHTIDMSLEGLMVATDHVFAVGTRVALTLGLVDGPFRVNGTVQSAVPTGPGRGIGIAFAFESAEQRVALTAKLARLGL